MSPSSPDGASVQPTRVPRRFSGTTRGYPGIPAEFPASIDGLPPVPFDGGNRAYTVSYRPYESAHDATGWRFEKAAVLSEQGEWFRVPFETLRLNDDTWVGPDTLGPGSLNSRGNQLVFNASSGAMVLDLRSGATKFVLAPAGHLGLIQWAPNSRVIFATAPRVSKDYRIDLDSGASQRVAISGSALGFSPTGQVCVAISQRAGEVGLECRSSDGKTNRTELELPEAAVGDQYQNWSSSNFVALRKLGGKTTYAYDLRDGHLVGELEARQRTATYMVTHGWISADRLLFSMSGYLVTWNPTSSELVKIATLPESDIGQRHGSVGLHFPPLPLRR